MNYILWITPKGEFTHLFYIPCKNITMYRKKSKHRSSIIKLFKHANLSKGTNCQMKEIQIDFFIVLKNAIELFKTFNVIYILTKD